MGSGHGRVNLVRLAAFSNSTGSIWPRPSPFSQRGVSQMSRRVIPLRKRRSSARFPEPKILGVDDSGSPILAAFYELEDHHRMTAVVPCPYCSELHETGRKRQIVVHRHGIPLGQHKRLKAGSYRSQPDNLRVAHCPRQIVNESGCSSYRFRIVGKWKGVIRG